MSFEGRYPDSGAERNPQPSENWQRLVDVAQRLVEQAERKAADRERGVAE